MSDTTYALIASQVATVFVLVPELILLGGHGASAIARYNTMPAEK